NFLPIWYQSMHCIPHVVYCPIYRRVLLTFAYLKGSTPVNPYFLLTRSRILRHQRRDKSYTISSRYDIHLDNPSSLLFDRESIPNLIYRASLLPDKSVPSRLRRSRQVVLYLTFRSILDTAIAIFFSSLYYFISYFPEPNWISIPASVDSCS